MASALISGVKLTLAISKISTVRLAMSLKTVTVSTVERAAKFFSDALTRSGFLDFRGVL